jgi:DNA-3-methyladenine glycosylase II
MTEQLTAASLVLGLRALAASDIRLAQLLQQVGEPPLWARDPGFPTLVHIMLEQQVSLASARAVFRRLIALVGPLTPQRFLETEVARLREIGFSWQKAAYCRGLAEAMAAGRFPLDRLEVMEDREARNMLLTIKGIGPWTADIYLLMALRRPDIWPSGDLALATAVQHLYGLSARPDPGALDAMGEPWRPWRAVAARLLWHYYLSNRAAPLLLD